MLITGNTELSKPHEAIPSWPPHGSPDCVRWGTHLALPTPEASVQKHLALSPQLFPKATEVIGDSYSVYPISNVEILLNCQ